MSEFWRALCEGLSATAILTTYFFSVGESLVEEDQMDNKMGEIFAEDSLGDEHFSENHSGDQNSNSSISGSEPSGEIEHINNTLEESERQDEFHHKKTQLRAQESDKDQKGMIEGLKAKVLELSEDLKRASKALEGQTELNEGLKAHNESLQLALNNLQKNLPEAARGRFDQNSKQSSRQEVTEEPNKTTKTPKNQKEEANLPKKSCSKNNTPQPDEANQTQIDLLNQDHLESLQEQTKAYEELFELQKELIKKLKNSLSTRNFNHKILMRETKKNYERSIKKLNQKVLDLEKRIKIYQMDGLNVEDGSNKNYPRRISGGLMAPKPAPGCVACQELTFHVKLWTL